MGIPEADKPEDFITALVKLQKDCGVDDLRMSDYGFAPDESMRLAVNARETMGGLFLANPCEMTDEECADIFEKSYRETNHTWFSWWASNGAETGVFGVGTGG